MQAVQPTSPGLVLALSPFNTGAETSLDAIHSEFGNATTDLSLVLPAGAETQLSVLLPGRGWPGVFTPFLDFGDYGSGPILLFLARSWVWPQAVGGGGMPGSGPGPLFGVTVNGVSFDRGTAEPWQGNPAACWHYDAPGGAVPLGLDANYGHVRLFRACQ